MEIWKNMSFQLFVLCDIFYTMLHFSYFVLLYILQREKRTAYI